MKSNQLVSMVTDALRTCLADVPFARLRRTQTPSGPMKPDLLARVEMPQGDQLMIIQVKSSGQPRAVRDGINALRRYGQSYPEAYCVFAAPYISERSAAICEEEGVGFLDLAGNCRLSFGQIYVRKTGFENPFSEKRELRSLYSPKASRILRVLLTEPRRGWKVQELAREADVSLGQVSNVKKLLADRAWIQSDADGLQLSEPGTLLNEWAANQRYRRDRRYSCYSLLSGAEFERWLTTVCNERGIRYAFTGFSAAARWAPMVRTTRMAAYIEGDATEIMRELPAKQVQSGANLRLIEPGDEGVFYGMQEIDGIALASPIQVYLDLKQSGGRGDEAAEALLNEVIHPRW